MSVEKEFETYIAAALLAVQDEMKLSPQDRESGAQDDPLQAARSFLTQATLDCHAGHLDRVELLLSGLMRAAEQSWNLASPLGEAIRRLQVETA